MADETPAVTEPATTAVPEAVATALAQLTSTVEQVRSGALDREAVEKITTELMAAQRDAGGGYRPDDFAPDARLFSEDPLERMMQYHTRDAQRVAEGTRRNHGTVLEFQQRADDVLLLQTIMSRGGRDPYDVRESHYYQQEFAPLLRAMDTATTAEGKEWVPTEMSADLIGRVNLQLRVAALFPTIPQSTPTYELPAVGVSRLRTGIHAEQTADTGQTKFKALTPATRKVTLVAQKLAARVLVSKDAEEDAIVPLLPWIRDELVDYLAADLEDAIINGDTTSTHMDADVTASDDPRKLWDGLRKLTLAGSKSDGGSDALTVADLLTNTKKMGRYGVQGMQTGNLAHIVSMSGFLNLLTDAAVLTVDKFGPQATILTGQLAAVHGVPLIVSEAVRQNLNASGVYDGTTITQSLALTVYRKAFIQGERRAVTTEFLTELYAESDQNAVIASTRRSFAPVYPAATEPIVAYTYNIDA